MRMHDSAVTISAHTRVPEEFSRMMKSLYISPIKRYIEGRVSFIPLDTGHGRYFVGSAIFRSLRLSPTSDVPELASLAAYRLLLRALLSHEYDNTRAGFRLSCRAA